MNLIEVLTVRKNRNSRDSRPFKNYFESSEKLNSCLYFINKDDFNNNEIKEIISKSVIINQVTSIEVYCKDMLDTFFKICKPNFYRRSLKEIHKNKYDIDELIFMHEKSVHPLELISFNQSFQNLTTIDSFFSKLLKVKVFEEIKSLQVRENEHSEVVKYDDKEILKQTDLLFNTRHELVHNPSNNKTIEISKIDKMLEFSTLFIFGLDIILINNFNKNK